MSLFALSEEMQDLSGLKEFPAVENTLSDGVEDTWTQ